MAGNPGFMGLLGGGQGGAYQNPYQQQGGMMAGSQNPYGQGGMSPQMYAMMKNYMQSNPNLFFGQGGAIPSTIPGGQPQQSAEAGNPADFALADTSTPPGTMLPAAGFNPMDIMQTMQGKPQLGSRPPTQRAMPDYTGTYRKR